MTSDITRGVVVVYIPESDTGPHRIVNCSREMNYKFFKRSDQHTYPMPYRDLASMFGRSPAASLFITLIYQLDPLTRRLRVVIGNRGRGYAERPAVRFFQQSSYPKTNQSSDLIWTSLQPDKGWDNTVMTNLFTNGSGCLVRADPGIVLYPGMELPVGWVQKILDRSNKKFSLSARGVIYALNMQPLPFSVTRDFEIDPDHYAPHIGQIRLSMKPDEWSLSAES